MFSQLWARSVYVLPFEGVASYTRRSSYTHYYLSMAYGWPDSCHPCSINHFLPSYIESSTLLTLTFISPHSLYRTRFHIFFILPDEKKYPRILLIGQPYDDAIPASFVFYYTRILLIGQPYDDAIPASFVFYYTRILLIGQPYDDAIPTSFVF